MVDIRQPDFKFVENDPEFDWDSMQTQEEVDAAVKELSDYLDQEPEAHRYKELIPDYVAELLDNYIQADNEKLESLGIQNVLSVFNYLEYGFEVDLDNLEKINERSGVVEFSTGNYPFGGIERFLITLRAFDLIPTECFDGFHICEFEWLSDFEYNTINLPEKTRAYLND